MKTIILISLLWSGLTYAEQFCVAHRGDNRHYLENSMEAIIGAIDSGVKGIEFDIRHTQDGVAILNHDETLARVVKKHTCNLKRKLKKYFYKDLKDCVLKNGETISTFEDVLDYTSNFNRYLFIELKDAPVMNDIELLDQYYGGKENQIFIISFNASYLDKFKMLAKQREVMSNVKVIRLMRFYDKKKDRFDGVDVSYAFSWRLKDKNKITGVWTKDHSLQMKWYFKQGVNFVTTNDPAKCQKVLESIK